MKQPIEIVADFLAENKYSYTDIERMTGVTVPILSKILKDKLVISMRTAIMLDMGTEGRLKAEEICGYTKQREMIRYIRGTKDVIQ